MTPPLEKLIEALSTALCAGVTIDEPVRRFAEEVFGAETAADILALLENPGETGAEPLLELVFSPDFDQLATLDAVISAADWDERDVGRVIEALAQRITALPVRGIRQHPAPEIPVTDAAITAFVTGCRLTRQLAAPIRQGLMERLGADRLAPLATRCRLADVRWTSARIDAVMTFMDRFDADSPLFDDLLPEVIRLVGEIPENMPLKTGLARKKYRLSEHLRQAQAFDKARRRHNMETLMMRGMHPPVADVASLAAEMDRLDMIGRILLGPAGIGPVPQVRTSEMAADDIREHSAMDKTIRFLS